MPFYKDAMGHGNLIITFQVEFPKKGSLNLQHQEGLHSILGVGKINKPLSLDTKGVELLDEFDESDMNPNAEGGKGR